MYNRRLLFGVLKIVCAVLLLCAMLKGYQTWQKQVGQQSQNQAAFSAELRPLTLRQRELELQLESLNKEYSRIVAGLATVEILAVDSGDWVDQKLLPALQEANMVGAVAMSLNNMPGEPDALSVLQVQKLQNAGWQLVYAFDEIEFADREKEVQKEVKTWQTQQKWKTGKEPPEKDRREKEQELLCETFKEWKQGVRNGMGELGIELDDVIYFKKGDYKRNYDSALRAADFDMIIHHGEEDRIIYADLSENKIWFPGAIPWNASNSDKQISSLVDQGANLVLTVSEPGDNDQDQFVSETFSSLLRFLDEYREDGTLEVCTFRDMANFQAKAVVNQNAKENERQKQTAQEELDAVNAQIQDIYAKYGMK